ncbi:hypothetical protein ACFE04_003054 [Oxalis oulophora]
MTQYAFQYAEPAEQKLEPFPFDAQIPALDIDTYISRAGVIPEARYIHEVILARLCRHKDGCKSMAQFNLIDFSLVSRASPTGIEKWIDTDFVLRKYWHTKWQVVNSDLKTLIKLHLIKQCCRYEVSNYDRSVLHEILDNKGDDALKQLRADIYDDFKSSINEVDFSYSLIVWHIATSICYNTDCSTYGIDILGQHCQSSKDLSDYMLYLQTVRRNMLPRGTGEIRFRDTCNEIKRFVCPKGFTSSEFSSLVATPGGEDPIFRIPGETKAVMREAIEIARMLKNLVVEEFWDVEEKWRLICQVWIEMLTYAAARCEWEEHIQELNRGRELLTHVSLLMAHMGLTNKVQILEYELETEFGIPPPPWNWNPLHQFTYYLSN